MLKQLIIILAISYSASAFAQDIKLIDYAKQYAKLKVAERKTVEIKTVKGVQDTIIQGHAVINEKGLPVHYTEYFARGRKMAEYTYQYDESGKLIKHQVSTNFNNWETVDLLITFDNKGRLISRELPEGISNMWKKETFTYNNAGVLIKNEHWYDLDGQLKAMDYRDYPPTLQVIENSLTYINYPNGLLMLHQLYNATGKVEKCWKHEYSFH